MSDVATICPRCGNTPTSTSPCSPLRCDAWITTAIYDHADREWVRLDDLNELPVEDGVSS